MRKQPETTYANTGDGYVGYQVFGEGPLDIVLIPSWATNVDVMWEEPSLARYLERLAAFGRVVCFDKRGSGISDPVPLSSLPTLEHWLDDLRVVLDAVGSERAALIGDTEGGPMAMLFAATFPDRVNALALINTFPRNLRDADYPIGFPEEIIPKMRAWYESTWGTPRFLDDLIPDPNRDDRFRAWYARYLRLAMGLGQATAQYWDAVIRFDVRAVLPSIRVPTLILTRTDARWHRASYGRYLAEHIPGAKYVELPGAMTVPFHGGDFDPVLDEVQEFLTGTRATPVTDRVLATVMFTDLVGSTERAADIGDDRWLALRDQHYALTRRSVERFRGQEIATTGDGFLATFDGPGRAVTCAAEVTEAVRTLGMEVRVGLHTGEVELREGGIGGLAVHIAQRVMSAADPGRILVSRTVKDLVVGSGIGFEDRGSRELKGVPGEWALYEVTLVP